MLRKLIGLILIVGILLMPGMAVYATHEGGTQPTATTTDNKDKGSDTKDKSDEKDKKDYKDLLDSTIKDGTPKETDESLVDITRPDSDLEIVYSKTYNICWEPKESDVKVFIAKYDEDAKSYHTVSDNSGDSSWDSDKTWYSKEFTLNKGANKFKLVAYRTSQQDGLKLEDIQVSCFTVTYTEKSWVEKGVDLFKDIFKDIIPKK